MTDTTIQTSIHDYLQASIAVMQNNLNLAAPLSHAADLLVKQFKAGKKLLLCGNGGSAADCQHFAAEIVGRFELEKHPLPAIALNTDTSNLTAIANDYHFNAIFSKQVQALGQAGDILLAISTSGNSANIIEAIKMAHSKGMHIITFTGKTGGAIRNLLNKEDVELCVHSERTSHIQEVHAIWIHALCEQVDKQFA